MTPKPFTYGVFDTTDGESELFGIVDAANMVGALEKAADLIRNCHCVSRVEIERVGELGHLGLIARLVTSKARPASSMGRTRTDAVKGLELFAGEHQEGRVMITSES